MKNLLQSDSTDETIEIDKPLEPTLSLKDRLKEILFTIGPLGWAGATSPLHCHLTP